jgi:hypothetical protein
MFGTLTPCHPDAHRIEILYGDDGTKAAKQSQLIAKCYARKKIEENPRINLLTTTLDRKYDLQIKIGSSCWNIVGSDSNEALPTLTSPNIENRLRL